MTESVDSAAYWRKLKQRLKEEGNEEAVQKVLSGLFLDIFI
jgi:hypothetical protein